MKAILALAALLFFSFTIPTPNPSDREKFKVKVLSHDEAALEWAFLKDNKDIDVNKDRYFQFITSGFKPGEKCTLHTFNIEKNISKMFEATANKEGELCMKNITLRNVCSPAKTFANGEEIYFQIISHNTKKVFYSKAIPRPIEYHWKDGATLSVTLMNKEASQYLFTFSGMKPQESFKTISKSGNEKLEDLLEADSKGQFAMMIRPGVIGQTGGIATFIVERKDEQGTVKYLWGDQAKDF